MGWGPILNGKRKMSLRWFVLCSVCSSVSPSYQASMKVLCTASVSSPGRGSGGMYVLTCEHSVASDRKARVLLQWLVAQQVILPFQSSTVGKSCWPRLDAYDERGWSCD